MALSHC